MHRLAGALMDPKLWQRSSVAQQQGLHGQQRAGARSDCSVRHPGPSAGAVPYSIGQRVDFYQSQLHAPVRSYGLRQEFITPHYPHG